MTYLPRCITTIKQAARSTRRLTALGATAAVAALTFAACTPGPGNTNMSPNANGNRNANGNMSATANANTGGAAGPLSMKEPERYAAKMVINAQGQAANRQGSGAVTVDYARMGADQRWTINAPAPIGQVTYLEKSGLKYIIDAPRSRYIEVTPEALGMQQNYKMMTPSTMIDQLKNRTQYQVLGTEMVNGKPATKYQFSGAVNTGTQAGTAQSNSVVLVDDATGLPVRAEIDLAATGGGGGKAVIEVQDITLSPDATLFEVPTGYRKVTGEELKQQAQGFINFLRVIGPMLQQQMGGTPPPPPPPASNANAARP